MLLSSHLDFLMRSSCGILIICPASEVSLIPSRWRVGCSTETLVTLDLEGPLVWDGETEDLPSTGGDRVAKGRSSPLHSSESDLGMYGRQPSIVVGRQCWLQVPCKPIT
ncbi:hypothetical protein GW17_00059889 [Ensete ventricosum]|nr:hypothetical protein GW17_00059889 [Ensete ventricosum]RZR88034.1 hypothetical protein BHM03_00015519 [Ensete ventricosum]